MAASDGGALQRQLERSRRLGFLGPGAVEDHLEQSLVLAEVLREILSDGAVDSPTMLDLGSGGGVPGLVLMGLLPWSRVVLLDRSERRCEFLRSAVAALIRDPGDDVSPDGGPSDPIEVGGGREKGPAAPYRAPSTDVVCGPAEELAWDQDLREGFLVVVARGFGPPAVTAECGVAFLRPGGYLLVTDPPGGRSWDQEGLRTLGLELTRGSASRPSWTLLHRMGELPQGIPRPERRSRRKPLF